MKSILVTGGAGYIGSHTIVELINEGYEVVSVDNFCNSSPKVFNGIFKITGKKIKNYNISLCDHKKIAKIFKGKKFEAIIHFAGYKAVGESAENPLKYYDNNINSLLGALIISKVCKVPNFIFSSTAVVYNEKDKLPYHEKSSLIPSSPYGETKKIGEEILQSYVSFNPKIQAISLRYFNPAGAHESLHIGENPKGRPNNLVPVITKSTKNKKSFIVFGNNYSTKDGTCIRDYIHVLDVAKAHIYAIKYLKKNPNCRYDVFNIGTGKGVSVMEMIKAFENINNMKTSYKVGKKRKGDVPILYANTKKAQKLLKWKSRYTIEDIMKTSWDWEKKNI